MNKNKLNFHDEQKRTAASLLDSVHAGLWIVNPTWQSVPVLLPSMCLMPRTCAQRIPIVMKSCGTMPMAPLRFLGESSPRYMGTTFDDRPSDRSQRWMLRNLSLKLNHVKNLTVKGLTGTNAHYEPSHNDDLIGLDGLTDSHHHSRNDGEDVVEEEGTFPDPGNQKHRYSYCDSQKKETTFTCTFMLFGKWCCDDRRGRWLPNSQLPLSHIDHRPNYRYMFKDCLWV